MFVLNNILKLFDGCLVILFLQDMIIGLYYLIMVKEGVVGEGCVFGLVGEVILVKDEGIFDLQVKICICILGLMFFEGEVFEGYECYGFVDVLLGQVIFNDVLLKGYFFVCEQVDKGKLLQIVNKLVEEYLKVEMVVLLDCIKDVGFYWVMCLGVIVVLSDIFILLNKVEIVVGYEKQVVKVQFQYEKGFMIDVECCQEFIKIWIEVIDEVQVVMKVYFLEDNIINCMVFLGVCGNWLQICNIVGMCGLVNNFKGEIILCLIIFLYCEGLLVVEYFIVMYGMCKGLVDIVLCIVDLGYLICCLVDVLQDVIICEEDCGMLKGFEFLIVVLNLQGEFVCDVNVENLVFVWMLVFDVVDSKGEVFVVVGDDVGDVLIDKLVVVGVEIIKVCFVLICDFVVGVCVQCYGCLLVMGKIVDIGEVVGIIVVQLIGEFGIQLMMCIFYMGGLVLVDDIMQGFFCVQEFFEVCIFKGVLLIVEVDGCIMIDEIDKGKKVILMFDSGDELVIYLVLKCVMFFVEDGQYVMVGQFLQVGMFDFKEIMCVMGVCEVQCYFVGGVQGVYCLQGVLIYDKYIEVIVCQMFCKVIVVDYVDMILFLGEMVDFKCYQLINCEVVVEGKCFVFGCLELMGIMKVLFVIELWLLVVFFQEMICVFIEVVMQGKCDLLVGFKENVIIGKFIFVGIGFLKYCDVMVEVIEEVKSECYLNWIFVFDGVYVDGDFGYVDFDVFLMDDIIFGIYN